MKYSNIRDVFWILKNIKTELFTKTVNDWKPTAIFTKSFILGVPNSLSTYNECCWIYLMWQPHQGRSEGTSSVAFEVLIINCQIYFINSFIFNCLTLNIKLFIFKLFDVKSLFSENHVFANRRERLVYEVMNARP